MRRDPKLTPESKDSPCCPETGTPEAFINSKQRLPSSASMDICEQPQVSGVSQEDDFLTTLSADTPDTSMNDIFGSVFGDSSPSSLELLTPVDPVDSENPEHELLPMTSKIGTMSDPAIANPILPHISTQDMGDGDIFPSDAYMGLSDELSSENFVDFSTSAAAMAPLEAMIPPSQMPELDMLNGYTSPVTWGKPDGQVPQPGQDGRMTIVIDKARPETLTQVMNVLMDSRARVEFRRG